MFLCGAELYGGTHRERELGAGREKASARPGQAGEAGMDRRTKLSGEWGSVQFR